MNIKHDLSEVAASLRCPEVCERQTVEIVCRLVTRFDRLETSEAYSLVLKEIPGAIRRWKEGKAHNLSSALWMSGRYVLLTACKKIKRDLDRKERHGISGFISLDASTDETANLHETIAGKSETIDWKDAFDFVILNAGFTDREKEVFLGLKDGKTLEQLGEAFGVSRQAIHVTKKAIETKANRIRSKVIGLNA